MTGISAPLASASTLRAVAAQNPAPPSGPSRPPEKDEFQAASPDKHKQAYETAYNAASAVGVLTRTLGKAGQYFSLTMGAMGVPQLGLGGIFSLIGGTYDVAVGASQAKNAAANRDGIGALQGNLQVMQGLATYLALWGPVFGSTTVGQVASIAALGAFAARLGVKGYGALKAAAARKAEEKAREAAAASPQQASPQPPAGPPGGVDPEGKGKDRKFEKAFAFSHAVDQFNRGLSGLGAFWTNVDSGIFGTRPGGIFGILGFAGGTYSLLAGVAKTRASAINRNKVGTVDGVLHTVQGLATIGAALGMGRIAGLTAIGAWAGRTFYTIYHQLKQLDEGKQSATPAQDLSQKVGQWTARGIYKVYEQIKGEEAPKAA